MRNLQLKSWQRNLSKITRVLVMVYKGGGSYSFSGSLFIKATLEPFVLDKLPSSALSECFGSSTKPGSTECSLYGCFG